MFRVLLGAVSLAALSISIQAGAPQTQPPPPVAVDVNGPHIIIRGFDAPRDWSGTTVELNSYWTSVLPYGEDLEGRMSKSRYSLVAPVLSFALLSGNHPRANTDLELTIDGSMFKVNGTTTFLVTASYFDAIHGSLTQIDDDFADLAAAGFNGVRIFPNWFRISGNYDGGTHYLAQDTLFDKDGNLRSATLNKLLDILDSAKSHGLIVDLSFTAETVVDCLAPVAAATFPPGLGHRPFDLLVRFTRGARAAIRAEERAWMRRNR